MADATRPGFWPIGSGHALAWYDDTGEEGGKHFPGDLLWDHPGCDEARRVDLMSGDAHHITDGGRGQEDTLTVQASLLCPDCGEHGWVTRGRWVQA